MNRVKLTILILAVGFAAQAQYPGYSPVADLAKSKTEFSVITQKTTSVKSDFTQEKNLAMLSEKIISKAKFLVQERQPGADGIQPAFQVPDDTE